MKVHALTRLSAGIGLVLMALSASTAEVVTLDEAESLALEHNRQVLIAEQNLASARAGVTKARANMLPSLSASAGYTRNIERPVFFAPAPIGQVEMGEANEHTMTLAAAQPLFLGFAGITGYEAAQTSHEQTEISSEQTRQNVLLAVREAYLGAALAREMVSVQRQAVAQAESSLALVQRRYDVGQASGFDLLQAQVQLANTRPGLVSAESNRRLADARLRNAIGLDPSTDVQPADVLKPFASRWADVSLDSLVAVASRNRPELLGLEYQQRLARHGVRLSRAGYYPNVVLTGRMTWQGQSADLVPEEFARSIAAGVQLSWTLWDSWKTQSSVQQARVGLKQAELSADLVREGIELEIEAAHEKLNEAAAKLASQETTVEQAKEALRLSRVRYANGSSTQLDVSNAQLIVTQTQTAYASSIYEYHIAHARLEKALGLIGQ